MEFGYVSSPSLSPHRSFLVADPFFDSTSESSSPKSPLSRNSSLHSQKMISDDFFQYNATTGGLFPGHDASNTQAVKTQNTKADSLNHRRRRASGSGSTTSNDKEKTPNMHLRRRAQNRASQRAFRERKEKHLKGLEHQLEDLHEKHQDLLQSYTRQADEVTRLTDRIAELTAELTTLRASQNQSFGEMLMPDKFDKFDAFSGHDMFYSELDFYYPKNPQGYNPDLLPATFEESL